jgi:membrane fusion protein (multidrug efflux system)
VGGIIQKRLFTEGSDVKAGQVLYQIDPASYRAAFASARAAQARAEANLIPARLKAERFSDLVKINAVSRQDYDDTHALLKQAEADVAPENAVETAESVWPIQGNLYIGGSVARRDRRRLVTASQPAALAPSSSSAPCVDVAVERRDAASEAEPSQWPLKNNGGGQARSNCCLKTAPIRCRAP